MLFWWLYVAFVWCSVTLGFHCVFMEDWMMWFHVWFHFVRWCRGLIMSLAFVAVVFLPCSFPNTLRILKPNPRTSSFLPVCHQMTTSIPQDQTKTKTIRGIQAGPHNYMILVAKNCLKIIIDSQIVHLPGIFMDLGLRLGLRLGRRLAGPKPRCPEPVPAFQPATTRQRQSCKSKMTDRVEHHFTPRQGAKPLRSGGLIMMH